MCCPKVLLLFILLKYPNVMTCVACSYLPEFLHQFNVTVTVPYCFKKIPANSVFSGYLCPMCPMKELVSFL